MRSSLYTRLLSLRRRCGLIFEATPRNVSAETGRLASLAERDVFEEPSFEYGGDAVADLRELVHELETVARTIPSSEKSLAARAEELLVEAELAACVGQTHFGVRAEARYAMSSASRKHAAELAERWILECDEETSPTYPTDGTQPEALLPRISALVRAHSPFHKVVVRADMASLAATGDEYVYVASKRHLTAREAERVAVHEVFGHVVPRVRAVLEQDDVGRLGTAHGEDTQEGYALYCEHRAGLLHEGRKRELAERHLACTWMEEGAPFSAITRGLVHEYGTPATRAVRVAVRTFRGSKGRGKGLGRERVYLPYYCLVRAHLEKMPADEARLTVGQRSLDELAP